MKSRFVSSSIMCFLIALLLYSLISLIAILFIVESSLVFDLIFTCFFILSFLVNCFFIKNNYELFCRYSKNKKVIYAVLLFVNIKILAEFIGYCSDITYIPSIIASFSGLPFSMMFLMFSALAKEKYGNLAKTFYVVAVIILFLANFMASLKLFISI